MKKLWEENWQWIVSVGVAVALVLVFIAPGWIWGRPIWKAWPILRAAEPPEQIVVEMPEEITGALEALAENQEVQGQALENLAEEQDEQSEAILGLTQIVSGMLTSQQPVVQQPVVVQAQPEPVAQVVVTSTLGEGSCVISNTAYALGADEGAVWMESGLLDQLVQHGGICTMTLNEPAKYWSVSGQITRDGVGMQSGNELEAVPGNWVFNYPDSGDSNGFIFHAAPAAPATTITSLAPTEAFCQLGVTELTDGVETHSLSWDAIQLRGYMNDGLAARIWENMAYCRTVFPGPGKVTLLIDSVAGDPVMVDGQVIEAGNGIIATGNTFEWVYPNVSRSNGHAYVKSQ